MSVKNNVIAVIDIGKTNKKVCIYSLDLKRITFQYKNIPAVKYQELDVEDIESIESWVFDVLAGFAKQYNIQAVSISTHGATAVCVDKDGKISVPVVAYTNEVPEEIHAKFYEICGSAEQLQKETATAEIKPLINIAKLLYFSKQRFPVEFANTYKILLLPQYFAYRLTGIFSADLTSAGCHTYLWNFEKGTWSETAEKLGFHELLPQNVQQPTEVLGTVSEPIARETGLSTETKVSYGIHDSNASLLPFLITEKDDFILNSTGTWCVAMHPQKQIKFNDDELGKQVFFNISAFGDPVKTSILIAGLEFETICTCLGKLHALDNYPDFKIDILRQNLKKKNCFILPGLVKGAGQYPESSFGVLEDDIWYSYEDIICGKSIPPAFADPDTGYHFLLLSIAAQSKTALSRAGIEDGMPIFLEGGFRKNTGYCSVLRASFPDNPLFLTDLDEATAFGAALIGKAVIENRSVKELSSYIHISKTAVQTMTIDGLDEYYALFEQKVIGQSKKK